MEKSNIWELEVYVSHPGLQRGYFNCVLFPNAYSIETVAYYIVFTGHVCNNILPFSISVYKAVWWI